MNLLSDVITYIRRIIKSPSQATISDNLIIDYINRFWINDVDARIQLFDLKVKYQFQTTPAVDKYNMPLYSIQQEGLGPINYYPVYQGFEGPVYINGIQVPFYTQRDLFYNTWPNVTQYLQNVAVGNGSQVAFTLNLPILNNAVPINPPVNGLIPGHVDINGIIQANTAVSATVPMDPLVGTTLNLNVPTTSVDAAVWITSQDATGANIVVCDSGQFLTGNVNYGLLMNPGAAPYGNAALPGAGGYSTTSNTVNYDTGVINVTFPVAPAAGAQISVQVLFFQSGLPRGCLFYNNTLTFRNPPSQQYLVELDAFLSPAAFLSSSNAIQYAYMAEYIARGAARKILADTGDMDQFNFYEPFFREQEMLVWKRSQRQWTATRTQTIYGTGVNQGFNGTNGMGGSFW
jgi:hypothetical protein